MQLTAYISLKACIPLRVGNENFHPVKCCWVFLYSGFVVLTLLQVLSLERVIGPLSQALCLCSWSFCWFGGSSSVGKTWCSLIMLFCVIHCVELLSLKPYFISAAKLCYEMFCNNSLTLLFCFRSVCYGCMNPTTYVWVTCRDPWTCGLSGSYGMPDSLLF